MAESTSFDYQQEKDKAYIAAQKSRRWNNIEFGFLMITAAVLCIGLIFVRANGMVPAVAAGVIFGYGLLKGIASLFRSSFEAQADKALVLDMPATHTALAADLKNAQDRKARKGARYSMNTSLFEGDESTPFGNAKYTHHHVQSLLYNGARQGLAKNDDTFTNALLTERVAREKTKLALLERFKTALDAKDLSFGVRFLQTPESSRISIGSSYTNCPKRAALIRDLIALNRENPLIEQKPGVTDREFCEETLLPLAVNVAKIFPDYRYNLDHVRHYGYLGDITSRVCGGLIDQRIERLKKKTDPQQTEDALNQYHFKHTGMRA